MESLVEGLGRDDAWRCGGLGAAAANVVYGFEKGDNRSTETPLFGVDVQSGNRQTWGWWVALSGDSCHYYCLRAYFAMSFKEKVESASLTH